jgi:hypothetical protein
MSRSPRTSPTAPVTARPRGHLVVTNPHTDPPLQNTGMLVLVHVEAGQHEPTRFDEVFHDRESPSGVRPGDLDYHVLDQTWRT